MVNRRQFIAVGLGTTLLSGGLAGAGVAASRNLALPYRRVVIDQRYGMAARFGALLESEGVPSLPFTGDLAHLTARDTQEEKQRNAQALVGMTLDETLFTLQLVAQDAGMRLVHRAEHVMAGTESEHFGKALAAARAVLALDPRHWSPLPARLGPALTGGRREATTLVSWVIAPRTRAPLSA